MVGVVYIANQLPGTTRYLRLHELVVRSIYIFEQIVHKDLCGEIWIPEVLFVYWWGEVAVAAERSF